MIYKDVEIILIDDDELIQSLWQLFAEKNRKVIAVFDDHEKFFKECGFFNPQVIIYIDSNLGNGIKGEVISQQIYEIGFKNIYLTTGFYGKYFPQLPWIIGIIGKHPPF